MSALLALTLFFTAFFDTACVSADLAVPLACFLAAAAFFLEPAEDAFELAFFADGLAAAFAGFFSALAALLDTVVAAFLVTFFAVTFFLEVVLGVAVFALAALSGAVFFPVALAAVFLPVAFDPELFLALVLPDAEPRVLAFAASCFEAGVFSAVFFFTLRVLAALAFGEWAAPLLDAAVFFFATFFAFADDFFFEA